MDKYLRALTINPYSRSSEHWACSLGRNSYQVLPFSEVVKIFLCSHMTLFWRFRKWATVKSPPPSFATKQMRFQKAFSNVNTKPPKFVGRLLYFLYLPWLSHYLPPRKKGRSRAFSLFFLGTGPPKPPYCGCHTTCPPLVKKRRYSRPPPSSFSWGFAPRPPNVFWGLRPQDPKFSLGASPPDPKIS